MRRCLIWGTGLYFINNFHMIQYYEQCGKLKIIGITSDESFYDSILGYSFVEKSNIDMNSFDILIIMSSKKLFLEIKKEAVSKGINEEKIVPIHVMALPGFDFEKYICIKKNIPTIFSPNCWGGVTYNSLGLEFKSPFINMYLEHTDYIKFLKNPKYYIDCPLSFERMEDINNLEKSFPIARCDDILLYFNHYSSFEDAVSCWNRRKGRIDWDNIIAMSFATDKVSIDEFCELPYEKKICFVPYSSNNNMLISIDYKKRGSDKPFWQIVNGTATGKNIYYDVFDLLLYNKVTTLAKV